MLYREMSCSNGRTYRQKRMFQRRIVLVLLTFLSIAAVILLAKTAIDIVKQRHSESIITSAQNQAKDIINSAKTQETDIITSAKKEAEKIIAKAKTDAAAVKQVETVDAQEKAKVITKTAEVKADEIVDNAINTKIDDIQVLLDITEAEAGDQPLKGKAAVAATIKNRVESNQFKADTIKEVVYAPGQFDPVANGTIDTVRPSASTIEAVKIALEGKDYSNGALYFYNPRISRDSNASWFNTLQTTTIIGEHVFKK